MTRTLTLAAALLFAAITSGCASPQHGSVASPGGGGSVALAEANRMPHAPSVDFAGTTSSDRATANPSLDPNVGSVSPNVQRMQNDWRQ